VTDEERFFAWLDGELTDSEAAEMAARVEADPELSALARRHRAMQERLGGALDAIAAHPVPEKLRIAVSRKSASVVDLVERRHRDPTSKRTDALPRWAMMAASLAAGIVIGSLEVSDNNSPLEVRNGALYAAADLQKALDTQLASTATEGKIRIGLTFRNLDGAICRTFTGSAADGLACHDNGRWQLKALFPDSSGAHGDYRMAGGTNPQLAELVDSTLSGAPMDAAQEKAAKERGWRAQ
jgi:hypothetical protein